MSPKVSIIMGIYNCEDTLEQSIQSILNQTYTNWELIMCDDFSMDKTYEIAKLYRDKHPDKIKLLKNEENKKLAATLNECLKYATGDYIARMDDDDICKVNRIEKQITFLENNPQYDLVGCKLLVFSGDEILGEKSIVEYPDKYTQRKNNPFAHPTILARRKVFDTLKGYKISKETQRCEDVELWFRFYEYGFKGYNIQESLYMYREDQKSLKKRKFSYGLDCAKVCYNGFKKAKYPKRYYIYILKPIIASFMPRKFIQKYQLFKMKGRVV